MDREYKIILTVAITSLLAFIIPKTLFYIISAITIAFMTLLLRDYYRSNKESREVLWSYGIIILVGVILIFIEGPVFEAFILIGVFIGIRTILITIYNRSSKKIEEINDKDDNIITDTKVEEKDIVIEKMTTLVDSMVNNFANTLITTVQETNGKEQTHAEKARNELIISMKNDILTEIREKLMDKSMNDAETELMINKKLDRLNDNLSRINERISKETSNTGNNVQLRHTIEEGFNRAFNQIKEGTNNDINVITNNIIEKLKEEKIDFSNTRHIQNMEIRELFIFAFKEAENEVNIISPWIGRWVLENEFLAYVHEALKRGVTIKIVYGIEDDKNSSRRDDNSEVYAKMLLDKFKKYKHLLRMKRGNTHYKLLICDEKYYLAGSFNFLSFKGDYSIPNTRHEGADYSENRQQIVFKRKLYFDF